ncbi:MAG TPA: hypothetical protein PLM30_06240, partial [Synergistales bacterium]|nr:hypothetical protein [Synergistales bacterium]
RALVSVPLHALCGLAMGYEAARQKMTAGPPFALAKILTIPVIAHGAFNYLLLTNTLGGFMAATWIVAAMWIGGFRMIHRSRTCS